MRNPLCCDSSVWGCDTVLQEDVRSPSNIGRIKHVLQGEHVVYQSDVMWNAQVTFKGLIDAYLTRTTDQWIGKFVVSGYNFCINTHSLHLNTPIHTPKLRNFSEALRWRDGDRQNTISSSLSQLWTSKCASTVCVCVWQSVCSDTCPPAQLSYWISTRLTSGDVAGRRQGPLRGATA